MFQRNMGTLDRSIRAAVGLALLSLAVVGPQSAWGWLGLIPLATAMIGWCPAYAPLGFSSCANKSELP